MMKAISEIVSYMELELLLARIGKKAKLILND